MALRGEYWWVRLRPDGLDWARCMSGEGTPRQEGRSGDWSELPAPPGARLMLCVPGERVRVHRVRLPGGTRRRQRAILPYALEEQLLRDPSEYHFVPLPRPKSQPETPVAVVERELMDHWLDGLEEHGWRPRVLVPEFLAIAPPPPGTWFLDAAESPFLLRLPSGGGGAALPGTLVGQPPGSLLLALEQARVAPATLRVRVANEEQRARVGEWTTWLESREMDLEIQEDGRSRPAWLARQEQPAAGCNLLTGPYASREDPRVWGRRLAPVAGLALGLLVVAGIQWVLEGQRIRAEHARLEAAIEETYREAFPDARNLVDPRYQMEQALEQLRQREEDPGESDGFLERISRLASRLAENEEDTEVESLAFERDELTLEVSMGDYEALERLERRLGENGSVEVDRAEMEDGRVSASLRLREED